MIDSLHSTVSASGFLAFQEDAGGLIVRFAEFTPAFRYRECATQILSAIATSNCKRIFIDGRGKLERPATFEAFSLGVWLAFNLLRYGLSVTALVSPEVVIKDRFFENVVQNRGLNLKVFVDEEQARRDFPTGS